MRGRDAAYGACILLLLVMAVILPGRGLALAFDPLKSVMPGKVSRLHEKSEGKCLDCHSIPKKPFYDKCAACHKPVKADIEQKKGYHGRIDAAQCETCHADHKGRENTLVALDRDKFDHAKTDYPLAGIHLKTKCASCHLKPKFRDTPLDCFSCHQKKDKHKGALGKSCERCHTSSAWKEIRFDHSKTKFPLDGKHQQVACEKCHTTNVASPTFATVPTTCIGCHRKDDKHKGILGQRCQTCHTARDWKQPTFDHDRTRFKLTGAHLKTDCLKCHKTPDVKQTPKLCFDCHRKDDRHKGALGQSCERCHTAATWKRFTFDHSTTKYPLIGKHADVPCAKCHVQERYKISMECSTCHTKDDVHKTKLGNKCQTCHTEVGWKETRRFDHRKTAFPLLEKHDKVRCVECHKTQLFKDTSLRCYDCHIKKDVHKKSFGQKCESCHTAADWKRHTFDHEKETGFALVAKHLPVKCAECHTRPLFTGKTSRMCVTCHRKDDIHQGELGNRCELCHTIEGFQLIRRAAFEDETVFSHSAAANRISE